MKARTRSGTLALAVALLVTVAAPAGADAKVIGNFHQVRALVPARVWEQVGFTPIQGMEQLGTVRIRAGRDVYAGPWANALVSRLSTTQSLREMRRQLRHGFASTHGVYADRPLTRSERRHFQVLVDLARDADVLVVGSGHPACNGLTLAQVRAIAAGRITSWSAVGATPDGAGDRIALRHVVRDGMFEARFGVARKPRAAVGRADGGVSEAARDLSVAAISSWSRVRSRRDVCAVPIDGVTPGDATVHSLSYKGAYPVTFVAPRKRPRAALPRKQLALYVRFLKSEAAAKLFRATGLLMKADNPVESGPLDAQNGPARDAEGRPISTVQDDAAALAALEGERLEQNVDGAITRIVFDPESALYVLETAEGFPCQTSSGRWTLLAGWRYSEHGGGVIAYVRFEFDEPQDDLVYLPNEPAGTAYYDGRPWTRSRALAGTC